jgi:hypothetical protein
MIRSVKVEGATKVAAENEWGGRVLKTRIDAAKPRLSLAMTVKPWRLRHKSKLSGSAITPSSCPLPGIRQSQSDRSVQPVAPVLGHIIADHGR